MSEYKTLSEVHEIDISNQSNPANQKPPSDESLKESTNISHSHIDRHNSKEKFHSSGIIPPPIHNFTQTQTFHSACLERKKNSFSKLKNWDLKRASFLSFHRNLIENLQNRLDIVLKTSQIFMNSLIKFLKERMNQEKSYFQNNPHKYNKEGVSDIYPYNNLITIIEEFEVNMFERKNNAEEFYILIEKEIMNEILIPEKTNYDTIVESRIDLLIKIRKQLTFLNMETSEKSAKYSTLYFTMINAPFGKKTEKDLYRREIAFMRVAQNQVEIQRKLAIEILSFWEVLKSLEINRINLCQKVIDLYLKQYEKCYSENEKIKEILKKSILEFKINIIDNPFTNEEIELIKNQQPELEKILEKFNSEEYKNFFEGFEIKKIENKLLVLKEMKASRDMGGIISNYNMCKLIITVDGFLLSCDAPFDEPEFKKPSMIINLEKTASIKVKDFINMEIVRIKNGFLMNTLEKFIFRFDSKDDLEEILEYINRYHHKRKD